MYAREAVADFGRDHGPDEVVRAQHIAESIGDCARPVPGAVAKRAVEIPDEHEARRGEIGHDCSVSAGGPRGHDDATQQRPHPGLADGRRGTAPTQPLLNHAGQDRSRATARGIWPQGSDLARHDAA